MPHTDPSPDEPADEATRFLFAFVTNSIAALLTSDPAKEHIAQEAALRLLNGQDASDEADLLLATQMTAFGLASLRALGAAHSPGLDPAETQRRLACAGSLGRMQDRLRRVRAIRGPVPMLPHAANSAAAEPDPQPDPQPEPDPAPAEPNGADDAGKREAWADVATEAAKLCRIAAARLPAEQRAHAIARADEFDSAARDVRAGMPPPFALPMTG